MTGTVDAIWVVSDRTADDVYVPTIEIGEDLSVPLGGVRPLMYAAAVYDAAARAEYDAAVLAQLDDLGVDPAGAAATVAQLREHRDPPNQEATAPLTFSPIVGSEDRRPYLLVALAGQPIGQWEPGDARQHADQVLAIAAAVPLDQTWALGRMLLPVLQVGRSGSVVAELRAIAEAVRHRIPEQGVVIRTDCDQAMAFLDRWAAGDMALPTGYHHTANDVWRLDRWARRVARYHTSMAWDHVQGHSGHLMNEAADSLAQLGRLWCDGTYDQTEVTERATRLIDGFFRDSRLAQVA